MKKETDTEFLARLMADGFGQVNSRLDGIDVRLDGIDVRLDGMDVRMDGMDSRFDKLDNQIDTINYQLFSLEKGQSEANRRLDSIERKLMGMLESIDETVHRGEFVKLAQRVESLEKASAV